MSFQMFPVKSRDVPVENRGTVPPCELAESQSLPCIRLESWNGTPSLVEFRWIGDRSMKLEVYA